MAVSQQQQQQQAVSKPAGGKHGNVLPLWGNEKTMNLNPMILTNVLSSPYFKVQLYELKTYHEVVDEIYFKVVKQTWADAREARGLLFYFFSISCYWCFEYMPHLLLFLF